jgi:transposase-like protein
VAQRKRHTPEFKKKVVLEALKEGLTSAQLASKYEVHPVQISQWKKEALEHLGECFQGKRARKPKPEDGPTQEQLYAQVGQLKVELDWLKKKYATYLES